MNSRRLSTPARTPRPGRPHERRHPHACRDDGRSAGCAHPARRPLQPAAPIHPVTPAETAGHIQPGPPAPACPPKTNVLAIIALIAGFFVPLAAFICGGIALSQITRTGDKGRGLAWSGIIVGAVMSVFAVVVSIVLVLTAATAVQIAVDRASQNGSSSAFQKPGCSEVGELVGDISRQMAAISRATGAERTEAISEMQEVSAEAHALAVTIDDPEIADAAENAVTALDDVIATIETAPTDASATDPGSALEAPTTASEKITALSDALAELETACR